MAADEEDLSKGSDINADVLFDVHDQTVVESLLKLFKQIEYIKNELENTIDCVGDMIVLVDGGGLVRRCNRTFKNFIGKQYDAIIGNEWEELFFGEKRGIDLSIGQRNEVFHPGSGRWFVVTSYAFDGGKNYGPAGRAVTIYDSTELKKITGELERKNRELEKGYMDLKSAHSQIIQQEKMASIGQLAAGVAHEINNPIGFILSNLGTLDKYLSRIIEFMDFQTGVIESFGAGSLTGIQEKKRQLKLDIIVPDTRALIKESTEGADRVKSIVRDLKSFSRVDDEGIARADINAGLESTINIVWNEIKYKATLKKEYGDVPLTKCNLGQLNQVFLNLLVNAAHSIEKKGEIGVKTWHENGSVCVSISDTGCGIAAENLGRIFEPFFTTKEAGSGTGLGLSIAYDIVKKHNGEITVASETGKGTTFTVRVPVVE
jgi:two-component system NtrC family sensor kinase